MKSAEEDSDSGLLQPTRPTQGYLRGLGSWRLGGSGIFELRNKEFPKPWQSSRYLETLGFPWSI